MIITLILVTVKIMLRIFINKDTGADIYQKQNIIITSVIILRKVTNNANGKEIDVTRKNSVIVLI